MEKDDIVKLGHGAGGVLTRNLVEKIFLKHLQNKVLLERGDSAVLGRGSKNLAFTTDSYVVSPIIFPGGDIGKLAIAGTINDLVVVGARPLYISAGFILEEGLPFMTLKQVVRSMAETAEKAGVPVVAADTKVVERGKADGMFINTAGVGELVEEARVDPKRIQPGDEVIVTGTVGDHGAAILLSRKRDEFGFTDLSSDCAPLHKLLIPVFEEFGAKIHWARDATRGGLITILNEAITKLPLEMVIKERDIPVNPQVRGVCDLLGLDPFYLANEGKAAIVVDPEISHRVLEMLRGNKLGKDSTVIGNVRGGNGKVYIETFTGGLRIADPLLEDPVPRIC